MNYVYILLLDEIPIYAGMTNNPVNRFKRHYMANDCRTRDVLRYYLFEKNKIAKMKIVYCNEDRGQTFNMEGFAIRTLHTAGFNIINFMCENKNHIFPKLTNSPRIHKGHFTKEDMQYIEDNINEIHKEYGYK